MRPKSILFVCTGNICRSPTAEAVMRKMVKARALENKILVDSAGTTDWHAGSPPDDRSQEHAALRGIDMADLRARPVVAQDFERFDWLLAMDMGHLNELRRRCPSHLRSRLRLLLDFAVDWPHREVADPYYGGPEGFEQVLNDVEAGCAGLLDSLHKELS